MSEYMKRDSVIKSITAEIKSDRDATIVAEMMLADVPEEDVIDVVRCKDCKHHEELLNNNDGNMLCWVHGLDVIVDRNGYCNYGEREEQEHGASKKSR